MIEKTVRIPEEDRLVKLFDGCIKFGSNDIIGNFVALEPESFNVANVKDARRRDILIEAMAIMQKELFALKGVDVDHKEFTDDIQTIVATKMAEEI